MALDATVLILTKTMALPNFKNFKLEDIRITHFRKEFVKLYSIYDIIIVLDTEYFVFLKNRFSVKQRRVREMSKLSEELYPYGIEIG